MGWIIGAKKSQGIGDVKKSQKQISKPQNQQ